MVKSDLNNKNHWPIRSAHFWCGLLAGIGLGLLLSAALVELEMLTSQHKAWVSLLGAVFLGAGGLVGWRGQQGSRDGNDSAVVGKRDM